MRDILYPWRKFQDNFFPSFILLYFFFSTDRSYFIPLYYEFMLCTRILFHLHSTYFQCKNTISLLFRRIVRVIFKWPSMQRSNTSIVSLFIKGNRKTHENKHFLRQKSDNFFHIFIRGLMVPFGQFHLCMEGHLKLRL